MPEVEHNEQYLFKTRPLRACARVEQPANQTNVRESGARNTVEGVSKRQGWHLTVYWRPANAPHQRQRHIFTRHGSGTEHLRGFVYLRQ